MERPFADFAERFIGLVERIAQPAIIGARAAVEIGVVIVGDEAVEAVDRRAQRGRIDLERGSKRFNRIGRVEEARLGPFGWLLRSRHGAGDHHVLHHPVVKNCPTGDRRHVPVPLNHGAAIGRVGSTLVQIARAGLINQNGMRSRSQPLRTRLHRPCFGARRQRQLAADIAVPLGDRSPMAHHLLDHLSGIAFCGAGVIDRRSGEIGITHLLIQSKPTGIDQHAQLRADPPGLALLFGHDANHASILDNQLLDRRIDTQIGARLQCGLHHAALQGRTGGHVALAGQLGGDDPQAHARQRPFGRPRFLDVRQLQRIFERNRQRQKVWPQERLVLAQFVDVEQVGHDGSARDRRTRRFIIVIRPVADPRELQPLLDQKVQHPRPFGDESVPPGRRCARRIIAVAHNRIEIGCRLLGTVRHAGLLHKRIVRNPHHPARTGRGAADQVGLFQNDRRLARRTRDQCRAHRAAAAAGDHKVKRFVKSTHRHCYPFPIVQTPGGPKSGHYRRSRTTPKCPGANPGRKTVCAVRHRSAIHSFLSAMFHGRNAWASPWRMYCRLIDAIWHSV